MALQDVGERVTLTEESGTPIGTPGNPLNTQPGTGVTSTSEGNLTHDDAAPGTKNVGVLPAVASAAPPTYTEGNQVLLSTDLAGNVRTTGGASAGSGITAGALTNKSGTVTTGGVSQEVAAAVATRRHFTFENLGEVDLWLDFGTPAVESQPSLRVRPGGSFTSNEFVSDQAINVIGAETGTEFYAAEAAAASGPSAGALTSRGGTIATADLSQQVAAADNGRQFVIFQNLADVDMWLRFGAAAVASQPSFRVRAGSFASGAFVSTQTLNVICEEAGAEFACFEAI